ncbi:MAG TPA: NAD-dependent epimerase/dehydratase family protein [Solirubrobacteraceae bacterium]|jgi:UDP-glucose 4-epimerase|nr:NAD-dependent epimerase/dehydratase family protein [Solirubrobacteraceae bacterium]
MDCLVTGGAGFIGSNLVDALVDRGDHVTVIDNLSSGKRANLEGALAKGTTLHETDVRDAEDVAGILAAVRPEVVFHLAAQIDVRYSVAAPAGDATTNVLGTIAVLEACRRAGVRRVVNTSTGGGLYGDARRLPTPEDYAIAPLAPYGQSKYAAEGYCALYTRLHGLSTASVRYGNVYGPRQDVHGEAGVVAIFCGHLVEGRRPTVFGDGRQTRDWVDVSDVVRANLLAAGSDLTGPFNIGHGSETSVLDLLDALRDVSDRPPLEPRFEPGRPGEVQRSCLDVTRARQELHWEATVSLRDGLRAILAGL